MSGKRSREKTVLTKQDIASKRKALNHEKLKTSGVGRRAIVGVALLAFSTLAFLAVATFSVHDRVGPGFQNAIGPVGHALAEALRGLLGVCAYVLPVSGFYAAGILFVGDRERRRWPQLVCLAMLLVSASVLAQLFATPDAAAAHAPGGLLGRSVGSALSALVGTVGTVVLMAAFTAVALIVGTQMYFLKLCAMAWTGALWLGARSKAWALAAFAAWKAHAEQRKEAANRAAVEEAAFLKQLEEQEAALDEAELAAGEAEAIAEEAARLQREAEAARMAKEAEKVARLAAREAKQKEREQRSQAKDTAVPVAPLPVPVAEAGDGQAGGDPAWALSLAPPPAAAAPAPAPEAPKKAGRKPVIIEPPPPPPEALLSLPPTPAAELATSAAKAAADVGALPGPGALDSSLAAAPAAAAVGAAAAPAAAPGAAILAAAAAAPLAGGRMPVIVEPKAPPKPTKKKDQEEFQFVGDRKAFTAPSIDVLELKRSERSALDKEAFLSTAEKLRAKLADFGIVGEVVEIRPGPVVTMYEFLPGPGIKISKIASLSDDLAMAMEAMRVRIVAPIPGKGVVGIEVPNKDRETVYLKEIAEQDAFQKSASRLTMCMGKDIEGQPYVLDLAKAPHLLIAGTTGSGKSVAVNAMIMSILLKSTPEEVRFIMVDPKMLELSVYEGIPHLLLPVVTDPRKASLALQWAVDEMTRRYRLLADAGVRNITGYNDLVEKEKKARAAKNAVIDVKAEKGKEAPAKAEAPKPEAPKAEAKAEDAAPADGKKKKKRLLIVDVAEETAQPQDAGAPAAEAAPVIPDLAVGVKAPTEVLEDPREPSPELQVEVKEAAREAEIRVDDVQTEEEKAALELAAAAAAGTGEPQADERKKLPYIVVIIDELADLMMVASKEVEQSIARLAQMARAAGIHLMVATQRPSTDVVTGIIKANFPTRISFMLRSKPDSMTIIGQNGAEALLGMGDMLIMPPTSAHLQRVHGCFVSETEIKRAVDHLKAQGKPVYDEDILKPREEEGATDGGEEDELSDELYDQALAIVSEMKQVSISMLQRKMRIGYNRAARMIERMERDGAVGPADGAKPRDVLIRAVGEMPGAGAPM